MYDHYPKGTVRGLLTTDQVTETTRQALTERLTALPGQPEFFSASEFALLQAICDRLIPKDELDMAIDIAGSIDKRLAQNGSDGWRYDSMPTDGEAYKRGLAGVNETAQSRFQQPFQQLPANLQDEILKSIQDADAPGKTWQMLPADRFFEELLAEAANTYYSHPVAQEGIGYVGMADAAGWQRIGLNQLEDREPSLVKIGQPER